MAEVFVLGAGFSKAVHGSMPLLSKLSTEIGQRVKDLPPPLVDLGNNVELWLTYLSQPQPFLKEYHNLQNRALSLRMTETIGEILDESTGQAVSRDCPDWLKHLIRYWHAKGSSVITLNYDTLIERAALLAKINTENIYPVPLTDVRRASGFFGIKHESSFKLFKLHGSVNWYYSGAASFQGEVLYYGQVAPWGQPSDEGERQSKIAAQDKVPLIVPPTTEKVGYFQHETLRQIWRMASGALQEATHVYCIGYSLPFTDLGIRFFLQHGRPGQKAPLTIVNKDKTLIPHYEDLLGKSYQIVGTYADAGTEQFAKDLPSFSDEK